MIIEDGGAIAATTKPLLEMVMIGTIEAVSELLRREHLEDNLDARMAWAEGTLQQHSELRGITRHACQTRSFSHFTDLDIFQKPQAQASDPRARQRLLCCDIYSYISRQSYPR
ncbi:hypothetical protein CY34DRAFT_389369 [Suillus luteus UH-Slu-Lm8-n1]|uniref:Uncharacterized protein n=1 Tax=Suillus luteus UH-Slu-Lm8-n1 TaxID=930992 RepID=A0A0C9ZLU7_9AGAM|nr:hypothetical protein CY34DRAFT_389369 [Suillus luteus UH-Slu-Lm8-n1]